MKRRQWTKHRPLFASPVPKTVKNPKIKWKILPILWLGFKRMCFFLGLSLFLSAFIGVYTASLFSAPEAPAKLPKEIVLYLPIEGSLLEMPRQPTFAEPFAGGEPTIHEVVHAIDMAAEDDRVKGLLVRLDDAALSLTHIQEMRQALAKFKEAGKFTKIYSSSYGDASGGMGRYYLASAFDEIWMQPLGIITIAGVKAEVPFLRGVLDNLGITPNFFQRKDYKTAYESLTSRTMSPENREMLEQIVDGIRQEIMAKVPAERGLTNERFAELIDKGLLTAQESFDAGLITHMDYADTLVDGIRQDIKGDPDSEEPLFVGIRSYTYDMHQRKAKSFDGFMHKKPRVALIYTVGAIMDTDTGGPSPLGASSIAASDRIAQAIIDAQNDDSIDTIVLRVDSPGGSPVASERILRALENAKNKEGKNIVVSMGTTAASGGYWVSAYADQIFALPLTITGSIGVVGGKFAADGLFDKIGVNWDSSVQWGENAGIWSFTTPFSANEAERINAMLDQVYNGFLERVSKGRNMSVEEVDKVAGGRIWTGERAMEVGLVDQMGGLNDALDYAATLSNAKDRNDIDVIVLPRPKNTLEQLLGILAQQGMIIDGLRFQSQIMSQLQPYLTDLSVIQDSDGPMVYEPFSLEKP